MNWSFEGGAVECVRWSREGSAEEEERGCIEEKCLIEFRNERTKTGSGQEGEDIPSSQLYDRDY